MTQVARRSFGPSRKSDLIWRCTGLAALGLAGLSTMVHRAVFLAHRAGPANALEALFGLLTFVFASAGILFIIHGRRLLLGQYRRDREDCCQSAMLSTPALRDRHAIASLLAVQAIERARQVRPAQPWLDARRSGTSLSVDDDMGRKIGRSRTRHAIAEGGEVEPCEHRLAGPEQHG